jgi:prolyl-tRNA editing enzyme YbaK/EbsC (Cys-tRNA(Pro) deacylase)
VAARLTSLLAGVEIRRFREGTATAGDAAAAIGCSIGQIVKSLVFVADGRVVVALVSGANRVDPAKLAAAARAARAEKAGAGLTRQATGFAIGAVPPFGHATALPTYVDRDLLAFDTVWAAAGRPDSVFPIPPERLLELSDGQVADLKAS